MRRLNYLSLGPSPSDERCAQVGKDPDYHARALRECQALIRQLLRTLGPPPDDLTAFVVKSCPHDFGEYLEVGVLFDSENERSALYAYGAEDRFPEHWDEAAREELRLGGEVSDGR
jgi:hypothetical protein